MRFTIQVADDVYRIMASTGEVGEFVDHDSIAVINVRGIRYAAIDGIDGDVFRCAVEPTDHEDVEVEFEDDSDEDNDQEDEDDNT